MNLFSFKEAVQNATGKSNRAAAADTGRANRIKKERTRAKRQAHQTRRALGGK